MTQEPFRGTFDQQNNCTIRGYVATEKEIPVTIAQIGSLAYTVYDPTNTPVIGHSGVLLTPADVWFDTPISAVVDKGWKRSGGYNFLQRVLYTAFPTPGEYRWVLTMVWNAALGSGQNTAKALLTVRPTLSN